MCGVAGIIGETQGARALIDAIAHRGPNGIRVEEAPGYSLAHARLSIIDLEGGWQPLHAAGSTIIGNGEIYNYVELAEEFQLKGKLTTGSDFEPLLHIYAQEGERAFDRLRGMYAFCLIGADGRTWLVRDPFGIKPLYIRAQHGAVAFSSEPRSFGAARVAPAISKQVAALNYTLENETAWPGVRRIEPGEIVEIIGGDVKLHRVRARIPTPRRKAGEGSLELAIHQLDRVLEDSIRVHQRSDVPYGLFLSGGIDSAAVATMMARLNQRPVVAYTCGFDVPEARDERGQAERVARALNLDWNDVSFGEEDFWRIAPHVVWAMDDPVADYACLPTYKLAEAAKARLTVVLTGEGGDELFAGYSRYRRALRPAWLGGRPAEPQVAEMFGGEALAKWRDVSKSDRAAPAAHAARSAALPLTQLQQSQAADIATWLPNDLLLKLDRMLMAHGLEGRTPFLDPEVAAFAFNLPDHLKVRGRFGKYLLRAWLEKNCPAAEPWAKKKGFTVPVASWIAPRASELAQSLAHVEAVRAAADAQTIRAIFTDDAHAALRWPLLFLGLWGRIHTEGAKPADALDSLLRV
ncbi:MAG TPA: asparagine synthase (glutamine-hydrolyzing) [Vitreimonas sp.]|uniref:asparagine synthase (glutamine-hydrolyzing) n=1 Tax=Vitreimonas sp. TaxID=3069702 RepID=UPI002D3FD7A6|nr:asparagine synthase (glutamine-hydrolyzing) [Vitreimonas sp.]HYD87587.1 asparagine synthase (glutamine-hydrolyzing) [Vitreimonas sp.]